jgi:DNA-binding LacI/PurR family transcriptional regulator
MAFKRARRITLKEVANKLGVSSATISNAFNRPSQLSLELREDILQSCKQLGYKGPKVEARQLRARKTKVIAIMLSNGLRDSFFDSDARQVLQGVCQVFDSTDYNVLLVPSSQHELKRLSGLEQFTEGFIVYGKPSKYCLKELMYYRKSIIAIDFLLDKYPSININQYQAAYDSAKIAFAQQPARTVILGLRISQQAETNSAEHLKLISDGENNMVQRLAGYESAANESSFKIDRSNIWNIPENSHFLAYETAKYALNQKPRPDLLLCMSDRIALGALKAATDLGISIPNDLLIVGFGDIEEAASAALTTISDPNIEKGRAAAKMFLGRREEKNLILKSPLLIRKTCP